MVGKRAIVVDGQKMCTLCHRWFPIDHYVKRKARCRDCLNEIHRTWVKNNPEKLRKMRERHMDKVAIRVRKRFSNPIGKSKQLAAAARIRARNNNLEYEIDWQFLLQEMRGNDFRCKQTGIRFDFETVGYTKQNRNPKAPSLDRIDNGLGYTRENVQIVCWFYNMAKSTFDDEVIWQLMREAVKNKGIENAGF